LWPLPIAVTVTAVVPDGPPARFRWKNRQHIVTDCVGPERIETGWWRGRHVQRDYFRVTDSAGSRFWLFRERNTGEWFLHGVFD
jgi:protein ImuB